MEDNQTFNYYLPQLGRITAHLYPHAIKCYNLLDKYGHIEQLKNMDQLGVIRNVYEGAHHPRWEYVILQLNVINRLKNLDEAKGLGLSSKTTQFLGYNPSGAEILQLWILLFNSGHLPGTFSSERALLKSFKESNDIRNAFKSGLGPNKLLLFNDILKNEDIYSIHKILISFYLDRYRRFKCYDTENKFVDFLQAILDFYLIEPKEKNLAERRFKLKSTFRKIRQISYLFLDSQYAPLPVNFDLSKIFLNLEDYYEDIFLEPESQIIRTLSAFDDLLSTSLYHSKDSISELGKHSKEIQMKLVNKNFNRCSEIHKYFINESYEFEPSKFSNKDYSFQILFDLTLDTGLKENFKHYLSFEREEKWNNLFGKNNCLITFQSSPSIRQYAINLRLFNTSSLGKNMKILGHLLKNITEFYFKLRNDLPKRKYESIDRIFQRPLKEIMINILKYITKPELYFEFKDYGNEFSVLPASGTNSASKHIEHLLNSNDFVKSRKTELNALKGTLKNINHRGKIIVSLSPILIYNNKREILTDLDGFAVGYSQRNLRVLLVEAKNQKNCNMGASRKQLLKTLNKLDIITNVKSGITESLINKCVFSYFTVDGVE